MTAAIPQGARLVLATHNTHKVSELAAILSEVVPGFQREWLVSAADLDAPEPVEDGVTFAQNSLIKARAMAQATGLPAIADDSGIIVDVLGGAPGIFSARWCGHHGDDAANLDLLLAQLSDVPDHARGAAFVAYASLVTPAGQEVFERGDIRGTLLRERHGAGGFGYDPIFRPDGMEQSLAEVSAEEKNRISHRSAAFRALAPHIAAALS